ncbi:iron complex outermembrane recepter protein [Persephonella hydrogeniphila]|uniref:Iron complex outermembrane recepter protein n=1 Tax=Persephonella hydrogeniphila TaxID=198703 RepID=A0A285NBB7_9AQUI|nr:TonB-dependent receptor plug domain-containing protein [Persephonella hydrogeniphila]SNZ06720.1 iron complex outermembrane recepter protein [Persephonella hydrogeniphila]
MEKKRWIILLSLSIICSSNGQSLEELLYKYENVSKLYKQTRQESEGHLIIITREEIKRYQYHRLSDVLKSLRYFSLQRNHYGEKILSYATIYPLENSTVRIYINDHEISAVFRKTALPLWADIPLDFVEHIEIYQGESAIKFNNEAAGMIIKIYTKKPERENGGRSRLSLNSRGGYSLNFYTGWELSDISSFSFFINKLLYKSKKYFSGKETEIDDRYYYGYSSFYLNGWLLETGIAVKDSNRFRGDTLYYSPDMSDFRNSHGYISVGKLISKELNLKVRFYADRISTETVQEGNIKNPVIAVNPVEPVVYWSRDINSSKVGADFSGNIKFKKNLLSFGGKFQRTAYKLVDIRNSGVLKDENSEYYRSIFIEDILNIFPKAGIVGGIKYENMSRRYGKEIDNFLWRVGLISILSEGNYFKTFFSKYYTPPYFVEIFTNRELTKQKNRSITAELSVKNNLGRVILTGGYIRVDNSIMIDPVSYTYYNADVVLKYRFFSIDYIKNIGNIQIRTNYFSVHLNDKNYKTAPSKGGFLKLSYKNGKFSCFSELIYREGYQFSDRDIKNGYDLDAGISLTVFKNASLQIRGYNLLNKELKTPAFKDPDFRYNLEDRRVVLTFVKEF